MEPTEYKIIATDIKRELPCKLSDEALLEVAIHKAGAELELDEVEDQFADVKREWAKRIEEIEKRIAGMGTEIRTRERKRVVICHERVVAATRMVETVREDTNEVVDRRAANLFEAGKVLPETKHLDKDNDGTTGESADVDSSLAAAAAETMKAAGVVETEEGDVIPAEGDAKPKKRGRKIS